MYRVGVAGYVRGAHSLNGGKVNSEKLHAEFGASGSERWLNCPGSIALAKNAPPQAESKWAQEGTDAHACLEFLVKNRHKMKDAVPTAIHKYRDTAMVGHAVDVVKWLEKKLKEYPKAKLLSEIKVDSSHFTCEGQFGTLDLAIVEHFGRLTVVDYKYGAGIAVDPEENTQMIYYALALLKEWDYNFEDVELVVVQPRAYHESGNTTRSWVTPVHELVKWERKFRQGVSNARKENAPLLSGKWCRFCPAAVICPEIKNKQLRRVQAVFDDEKGLVTAPKPEAIAIKNLGTVLTGCDRLEEWIGKVREHALHVVERGGKIEGWKLVNKRSTRHWIDEKKTATEAKRKWGDKAFSTPNLLSPAQLEKSCKPVRGWVSGRVSDVSSGVTLVPEGHRQQAVNPVEKVFGKLENKKGKKQNGKTKKG